MKDYRMGSGLFTPQSRQFIEDFRGKYPVPVAETVNLVAGSYVKDAAGSTIAIQFKSNPILNLEGSNIGSFWGDKDNLQYEKQLNAVIETDTAATCSVIDGTYDLEKLFESTGKGRYIAKVYDGNGISLYGWIGGVAVSGSTYTFSVYNSAALATNSWFQGGATAFVTSNLATLQIYKNSSSFTWAASDTFSEEVAYTEDSVMKEIDILKGLSDGQYAIDYNRGRALVRKLDADDTETASYLSYPQYPISGTPVPFRKTITTAGTPERVTATSTPFRMCVMQAINDNTGWIARGDSTVDAADGTELGEFNTAGNFLETLYYGDLYNLYIDSTVNGEGVTGWYIQ